MLAAEELGGLAEDNRRAQIHQLIGHIADHAVRRHAGSRIRCAALDGHDHVRNIRLFALLNRDFLHKALCSVNARLNRAGGAAQFLNADDLARLAAGADLINDALSIRTLAAKAHHQRRAHIRALAEVRERIGHALKVNRQLTAALMMEIAHSALHLAADGLRNIVRADDARDHGHEVSRAVFAVLTAIAHKGIHLASSFVTGRRGRAALQGYAHGRIRPF